MRHAWTIAAKDLRRRLRDRTALLVAVVLPFGLAWIFSLTLGDVETAGFEATYAVVDTRRGRPSRVGLPRRAARASTSSRSATPASADDAGDARRGRRHRRGVRLPRGVHASRCRPAGAGEIRVIGSPDSSIGSLVAVSLARSFGSNLNAIGLSVAAVARRRRPVGSRAGGAGAGGPPGRPAPDRVARRIRRPRSPRSSRSAWRCSSCSSPSSSACAGLLEEREDGTLSRLLVAPVNPASVIGGKALASFAVGLDQHRAAGVRHDVAPRRGVGGSGRGGPARARRRAGGGRGHRARRDARRDDRAGGGVRLDRRRSSAGCSGARSSRYRRRASSARSGSSLRRDG